jgi:hypothetical protein
MSVMTYDGIELPYADTTSFSQEAVSDDTGEKNWLKTKFDITVQFTITADYLGVLATDLLIANQPSTDNAAVIMKTLRARLLRRRRKLTFSFNGVNLIPADTGGPGTVDVDNGPIPQRCDIVELTNSTFIVIYRIIAHYWEDNLLDKFAEDPLKVRNRSGCPVVSNSWTETVNIDEAQYTTRTREGKFQIRSDNDAGQIADWYRAQFAVCGVLAGCIRREQNYIQSNDGLAIQYRIVDQEVYKMPPTGAYVSVGDYIETSTSNGNVRYGEISVTLTGSKISKQSNLISLAIGICSSKLQLIGPQLNKKTGGFGKLEFAVVRVGMYDNLAECRMRAMLLQTKGQYYGKGKLADTFLKMSTTPFSDNQTLQPTYAGYGTAFYLMQAAAYYDQNLSIDQLKLDVNGQTGTGLIPGQAGKIAEA